MSVALDSSGQSTGHPWISTGPDPWPLGRCIEEVVAHLHERRQAPIPAPRLVTEFERFPRLRQGERPYDPRRHARLWELIEAREFRLSGYVACHICGRRRARDIQDRTEWQLDHLIPWSANGCSHVHNLRPACTPCNSERSNYRVCLNFRSKGEYLAALACVALQTLDLPKDQQRNEEKNQ